MSQTRVLTIRLADAAAKRLEHAAAIARRPIDDLISDALNASLPPPLDRLPSAARAGLELLETLTTAELCQRFYEHRDERAVARLQTLLDENAAGTLQPTEEAELDRLVDDGDRLMLQKAYAAALLKLRGERLPTWTDLTQQPD